MDLTFVVVLSSVPPVSFLPLIAKVATSELLVVLMISLLKKPLNKRSLLELGSTIHNTTIELKLTISVFLNSVEASV